MKTFHTIYVLLVIPNVILSKHMPIYCFSLAYASFEYGFVDTHAQVDVWKEYHILVHIMHMQILI
jgi:hypothetical protein